MSANLCRALATEADTRALGAQLAAALPPRFACYLHGDLGSGKTTLARALVQALLPGARVKSPTYTLLESYEAPARTVHHLDLYRIAAAGELDALGLRDLDGVLLIEWPERGAGHLPTPDLVVSLALAGEGRAADLQARSTAGSAVLAQVARGHASEPV